MNGFVKKKTVKRGRWFQLLFHPNQTWNPHPTHVLTRIRRRVPIPSYRFRILGFVTGARSGGVRGRFTIILSATDIIEKLIFDSITPISSL